MQDLFCAVVDTVPVQYIHFMQQFSIIMCQFFIAGTGQFFAYAFDLLLQEFNPFQSPMATSSMESSVSNPREVLVQITDGRFRPFSTVPLDGLY